MTASCVITIHYTGHYGRGLLVPRWWCRSAKGPAQPRYAGVITAARLRAGAHNAKRFPTGCCLLMLLHENSGLFIQEVVAINIHENLGLSSLLTSCLLCSSRRAVTGAYSRGLNSAQKRVCISSPKPNEEQNERFHNQERAAAAYRIFFRSVDVRCPFVVRLNSVRRLTALSNEPADRPACR